MREHEKSGIHLLQDVRTQLSRTVMLLGAMSVFAVAMAIKSDACTYRDCLQNSPFGYSDGRMGLKGPPDEMVIKRAVKLIRQCDPELLRYEQCWMLRHRQACKQAVATIEANRAPTLGAECHGLLVRAEGVIDAKTK